MHKAEVKGIVKPKVNRVNNGCNWDVAIADAQRLIQELKIEIEGLNDSVRVFIARRDAAEPWPGPDLAASQ